MRLSIIIVNYNTKTLLSDCLCSILAVCRVDSYEVIVVDNASKDGSVEMLKAEFGWVRVIASAENLGFGRANNLALELAYGEFILFLNSDTLLVNDAPQLMCSYMEQNPSVGVVGANLYRADMSPNQSFHYFHSLRTEFAGMWPDRIGVLLDKKRVWFNESNTAREINGYISGAGMMVRSETLRTLGGFDPDFFMYFEDMELCLRIRRSGMRIVSLGQARIIHLAGGSCAVSMRRLSMLLESKYKYYTKTRGASYANCVYLLTQGCYRLLALIHKLKGKPAQVEQYAAWAAENRRQWRSIDR